MKFKEFIDAGVIILSVVIALLAIMSIAVFPLIPTVQFFGDILIIIMIGVQLMTVIVLLKIYEKFERGRKK